MVLFQIILNLLLTCERCEPHGPCTRVRVRTMICDRWKLLPTGQNLWRRSPPPPSDHASAVIGYVIISAVSWRLLWCHRSRSQFSHNLDSIAIQLPHGKIALSFMIMVLSMTDLCVATVVHPLFIVNSLAQMLVKPKCIYKFLYQEAAIVFVGMSTMTLFAINIERYMYP